MTCQQCRVNMCRPRGASGDGLPEAEFLIEVMGGRMAVCRRHKSGFERRMRRAGRDDFKIFVLPQNGQEAANAEAGS